MRSITIRRPDDWHVHFRDGAVLEKVVPFTARTFGRAIVMPNLTPPITTATEAAAYRDRILRAVPPECQFRPLITCYLTDQTDASDLVQGHRDGIFTAAKLYPAHATTNSHYGVTSVERISRVLEAMADHAIPLLMHGEEVGNHIDIFDRERAFIDHVLVPLMERIPHLRAVMEHITTKEGVEVVRSYKTRMGATITPQHLLYNRNAIFQGGLRPHMYCLPVLKREEHRLALRSAATSGEPQFFLGTDTAPHLRHLKESSCGCAGVFSAPVAMQAYLKVFAEEDALDRLEAFASLNGPAFYNLPPNEDHVTFKEEAAVTAERVITEEGEIVPLFDGEITPWAQA